MSETGHERTLEGALTFLGFALGVIAVFYFAVEFIPLVSPWTQVATLLLLAVSFAYLGVWLKTTAVGGPFFQGPRLRWLRPSVVLWLMAIVAAIASDIVFLGIDDVPKPAKVLITLLIGIGLIVFVARQKVAEKE